MSETSITRDELNVLVDPVTEGRRVQSVWEDAAQSLPKLLTLSTRYTSWNALFGSGVATLAGKIGRNTGLFIEEGFSPVAIADRSVLVGSYFFDAARDEFDDRDTEHRDTHRCLAQAYLLGILQFARDEAKDARFNDSPFVRALMHEPLWLGSLRDRVAVGYGAGSADTRAAIFRAMGYHLGSELLADAEFSVIDRTLRAANPELVDYLSRTHLTIAGQAHEAYYWLRIHSSHGGGAEADHFAWAIQGVDVAFRYTPAEERAAMKLELERGYEEFASDHRTFFEYALTE